MMTACVGFYKLERRLNEDEAPTRFCRAAAPRLLAAGRPWSLFLSACKFPFSRVDGVDVVIDAPGGDTAHRAPSLFWRVSRCRYVWRFSLEAARCLVVPAESQA